MTAQMQLLQREMYSEAEAARLLGVAQGTLHYWLDGGTQRGVNYPPVIRPQPTGQRSVTWAEFIEAGLLREYRREHQVPLAELRDFIDRLRTAFQVPYPLAHAGPLMSGQKLVYKAQIESGMPAAFALVAWADDQILLTGAADRFVTRVTWREDIAAEWRPHNDPASTVRINPDLRFGRPAVGGVSTEVLWEQAEGGASPDELAADFALAMTDVRWALAYEGTSTAAA